MQSRFQQLLLLSLAALLDASAVCDTAWKTAHCDLYCTGYLAGKCCTQANKFANMTIVANPPHQGNIQARGEQYFNCTGGKIDMFVVYDLTWCESEGFCSGFDAIFQTGRKALEDAEEYKLYDAYMTQAQDLSSLSPYIENLNTH